MQKCLEQTGPDGRRYILQRATRLLVFIYAVSHDINSWLRRGAIKRTQFKWNEFKVMCSRYAYVDSFTETCWVMHTYSVTNFKYVFFGSYSLLICWHIPLSQNLTHPIAWNTNSTHSAVCWISEFVHQMMPISFWPEIQMKDSRWSKSSSVAGETQNRLFGTTKPNRKLPNRKHRTFWMLANTVVSGFVSPKALSPLDVRMRQPLSFHGKTRTRSLWTSSVFGNLNKIILLWFVLLWKQLFY